MHEVVSSLSLFRAERREAFSVRLEQIAERLDISAQPDRAEVDEWLAEGRAS